MTNNAVIAHIDDFSQAIDCKGFNHDKLKGFIIKKDNHYFAYRNSCPHLGIGLNWEDDNFFDLEKTFIHCFTHGALFLIETGQCVSGPCLGKALQPLTITVKNNGHICLVDYNP